MDQLKIINPCDNAEDDPSSTEASSHIKQSTEMITNIELETMSLLKQACRKYINDECATPDWEQRRYEIAKDVAAARLSKDYGNFKNDDVPAFSVRMADLLITELKKPHND